MPYRRRCNFCSNYRQSGCSINYYKVCLRIYSLVRSQFYSHIFFLGFVFVVYCCCTQDWVPNRNRQVLPASSRQWIYRIWPHWPRLHNLQLPPLPNSPALSYRMPLHWSVSIFVFLAGNWLLLRHTFIFRIAPDAHQTSTTTTKHCQCCRNDWKYHRFSDFHGSVDQLSDVYMRIKHAKAISFIIISIHIWFFFLHGRTREMEQYSSFGIYRTPNKKNI